MGGRCLNPVPEEELKRLQQEAFEKITTCVYCSQPMTFCPILKRFKL